ncbi:TPA: response regulator transcription factor [Serratia fonticola]
MKPHIVIAIQDTNRFFALGIQHIVQAYFQAKGCTLDFVPLASAMTVDLLVWAKPYNGPMLANRLWEQKVGRLFGTIVVRESLAEGIKPEKAESSGLRILGRRERAEAMVHLLEQLFDRACLLHLQAAKERACYRPLLTPRERDILQGIYRELTPCQIANALSLNVKTVSTHKLTAMRKLGFRRNSELYYWLRQGGLELGKDTL